MKRAFVVLVLVFAVTCGPAGAKVAPSEVKRLEMDSTRGEVERLFGGPGALVSSGLVDGQRVRVYAWSGKRPESSVQVTFKAGRVNAWVTVWSAPRDDNPFTPY